MPILFRWGSLLALHLGLRILDNDTRFWEMPFLNGILHVLSNTWVTIPIQQRNAEDHMNNPKEQVSNAKEITGSLVLSGINILVTGAITIFSMENRNCRILRNCHSSSMKFLLLAIVPGLTSHLAGCGLLAIYYYCCHPWKKVFRQKKAKVRKQRKVCSVRILNGLQTLICRPMQNI